MIRRCFLNVVAACAIALAAFSFGVPVAAASGDPDQVIQSLADRAIALLQDDSVNDADREERLRTLLNDGFNIEAIARFTLGRYWRKASDAEQARFLDLFEDWIVKTYSTRFKDYSGQTFSVVDTVQESERISVVQTQIESPNGETINAGWHMQKFTDGYKVVDVEIEGVRMAVTQRSEFAAIIKRSGSIDGLIEVLEKQVKGK